LATELSVLEQASASSKPEYTAVAAIAQELHTYMLLAEVADKFAAAHVLGAKSGDIQAILLEKAIALGFQDERKGLFAQYKSSGLRPDYYKQVGSTGILMEVERGKILANNMDLLDLWKCHVCREARYLFLVIPRLRHTKKGKYEQVYGRVRNRLSTFFADGNAVNVDAVFLFGY
jgi:hypothetical protein